MQVQNINENEINKFIQVSNQNEDFQETVESMWADKRSCPEWSFVIEEGNRVIGRVGYWAPPGEKDNLCLYGLALPWEEKNVVETGVKLIRESMEIIKNQNAKFIDVQLHSSDGKAFTLSKQIYAEVGLEQIQAKKSFSLSKNNYLSGREQRLDYKNLKEVGQDKFIDVIEEVTRGTLDEEDKLKVEELGNQEAAVEYFNILQSIDDAVENWFLGYKNMKIVGLIIPQHLYNQTGAINYIGVVPDERGRGYGVDLLHKGIENLWARDIEKIIADIDIANFPMKKALVQVGFKVDKEVLIFRKKL